MGRKEQERRSAEEKWGILQEGLKSGNIAETGIVLLPGTFMVTTASFTCKGKLL